MRIKMPRNWTKTLCGAAGLLLFVYLILRTGVGPLMENLSRFGIWFPAILAVGASWLFFQACAWSIIQNAYFRKVPFGRLLCVRIIGDALNILLPSASLGGDAARAYMIRDQTPLKEGIAGVLFDKTIEFIASTVFLAASLLLGSVFIKMPEGLLAPTILCLIVTTAGLVFLVFFSARGFYDILLRMSGIIPRVRRWIIQREDKIKALEGNLRLLYRKGNLRSVKIVAALAFHFLARVAGAVEVLIILRVLGLQVHFIQAVFIFTVVVITNTIFFLLPGQWGITESASILVMQSLGYPASMGLSLSVIRRIRKLAFVAIALILFIVEKKRLPEKGERSIAY